LLRTMRAKNILVEICLTSNDMILGVRGPDHPLPMYLRYGVAVALATDDEGVSRSDLDHEYLRAHQTYDLSYQTLKQMARSSLEHAFVPGISLFAHTKGFRRTGCQANPPSMAQEPPTLCQQDLRSSERARLQWKLEEQFAEFEATVGK